MLGAGRTFCSPPTLAASVSACCLSVGISVSICIYLCRNLCKSLSVSSSVFQNLTSVSQLPCLPTSAQVFIPSTPPLAHPSPRYDSFTLTKGSSANTKMMRDYVLLLSSYLLLCVISPSSSSTQHIFVSEAGSQLTTRVEPSPGYTCVCVSVCSLGACASNHCRKFWNTHRLLVHFLPYTGNGMAVFGIVWEQVSRGW